jgi:SAM-dependent methyltransferase
MDEIVVDAGPGGHTAGATLDRSSGAAASTDPADYPLGRTPAEARRLMLQHRLYADATRQLLVSAGVSSGMRVLDVGSGAGHVALLLADLVGPTGEVVGIEFAPESIALAADRVDSAGVSRTVRFVQADLRDLTLDEAPFDAVVGRWVLMYQPDPPTLLRQLAGMVRPGGIVAFQESDLVTLLQPHHPSPLNDQIRAWLTPPADLGGPEPRMGPKLFAAFVAAGLTTPAVRIDTPAGGGRNWPGYEYVAATVRSLLPLMTALGLADPDDIDLDTLAERLRDEITAHHSVLPLSSVYGVWARVP